jgi:hypothetical protein
MLMIVAVLIVVVIISVGLVVEAIIPPDEDNAQVARWIAGTVDTILGVIIGFFAGRTLNGRAA